MYLMYLPLLKRSDATTRLEEKSKHLRWNHVDWGSQKHEKKNIYGKQQKARFPWLEVCACFTCLDLQVKLWLICSTMPRRMSSPSQVLMWWTLAQWMLVWRQPRRQVDQWWWPFLVVVGSYLVLKLTGGTWWCFQAFCLTPLKFDEWIPQNDTIFERIYILKTIVLKVFVRWISGVKCWALICWKIPSVLVVC